MSQEKVASGRSSVAARLASLGFRLTMRYPAATALVLRLMLLVPARWWPRRNATLVRGFGFGADFARLPRDDVMWAAYAQAISPLLAPEFAYEDNFLPDHVGETYRGLEGLRRAWTGFVEPFEEMAYAPEGILGSGDRLVSIHRVRSKARHTGIAQEFPVAYIWTFSRGRIVHSEGFLDADQAVKAAGLD